MIFRRGKEAFPVLRIQQVALAGETTRVLHWEQFFSAVRLRPEGGYGIGCRPACLTIELASRFNGKNGVIKLHIFFAAGLVGATASLGRSRVIFRGFQNRVPVLRAHSFSPAGGEERVIKSCIFFTAGPRVTVGKTPWNLFSGLL